MTRLIALVIVTLAALATPALAARSGALRVDGTAFRLKTSSGRLLGSGDLVGASFEMAGEDGASLTVRIDAANASVEKPYVELLALSVQDRATGRWAPMCDPDITGRRAGFPVAGRWDAHGRFHKDGNSWFLTCTSGAQGKCVLWGYDPWRPGPHGEDLAPIYEACTHMVRADYAGKGAPFTRNGTSIDVYDIAGVQTPDSLGDPTYRFEAGWSPTGAVCVAKTRYAELLPLDVLLQSDPQLAGPCDEASARKRGAVIFNRSR